MDIEWDGLKRIAVLKQRRVDILYAALIFDGPTPTGVDDRKDYGEIREISIGMVDGECFVVVHTDRGGATRIITAWKGGRDETERCQASLTRRDQRHEEQG